MILIYLIIFNKMPYTSKEKQREYKKEYYQSPNGKKKHTINNWKRRGLVTTSVEEMDKIYARYIASERCEKKGCEYTKTNWKCMDHEHLNGKFGAFRNIICNTCNVNDKSNNTSGTPNVFKHLNGWKYQKQKNKKTHQKYFKTKEEAIDYKIFYES